MEKTWSMFWEYMAFVNLWSIREIFEQIKRVEKGWYLKKS
ncbi:DUF4491 family protein [Thermosyntropha sp.]|nr:DUF4491 family protein [Thermosyntropha sp.]MBO8159102.1 DUF4491 family protein [Thermosyntropha sp.]